jgi:hypothetical protein
MGVFPLAGTMSCFSNSPLSRGGNTYAPANGRTDEVWWHPHPTTTPRRNAAAAHSPIHYIDYTHALSRCPGTDTSSSVTSADGTSGDTRPFVYRIGPMDRPQSVGRLSATSRMPALQTIRHACGTRARLQLPQSSCSQQVHPNAVEQ